MTFRSEQDVFTDLASLCTKPGYVHALAYLCFRENCFFYANEVTESDIHGMASPSRLIRTEINTLMGLMVRSEIDWQLPNPVTLQKYITASEELLQELHAVLSSAFFTGLSKEDFKSGATHPLGRGAALREPIFYGGESAYVFQYWDLAAKKYAADATWMLTHRGFTVEQACVVAKAIEEALSDRFEDNRKRMQDLDPEKWTMLPCFAVSACEVAAKAGSSLEIVERVLEAFSLSSGDRNAGFCALQDFNAVCATPLLRMPGGEFLALQSYALAEALYDTPFYWMAQDKAYLPTLTKNRGYFTESFVAQRLALVFGKDHVYSNVEIFKTKSEIAGEIDVLVVWGDRAIVVQAKSKRLTLAARKGNDQVIQDDFKKSVQNAYEQAIDCARHLNDDAFTLRTADGCEVSFPHKLNEIYIFCVVSDHYPALSFQARQFLKTLCAPRVQPPLVMDIFTIDAVTEMLPSPLQFLSYVNRRANYADRIVANQELEVLAYHLKHNLWMSSEVDVLHIGSDFSAGLDIAMGVRRNGLSGAETPDGILTRLRDTALGRIVEEIEEHPEPATIDLGFLLLTLGEETFAETSQAIDRVAQLVKADGAHHDLSLGFGTSETGLTVHCNNDQAQIALARLESHCERRKYKEKASRWFGLWISPDSLKIRAGVSLTTPWAPDESLELTTQKMSPPLKPKVALALLFGRNRHEKIGRNQPCPCGSGHKHKKCCLRG